MKPDPFDPFKCAPLRLAALMALPISACFHDSIPAYETVHVEKRVGSEIVRLVETCEQFGDIVPETGDRLWRTLLYIEVRQGIDGPPRRVWHMTTLGKGFVGLQSIVTSDVVGRRLLIAVAFSFADVAIGLADLDSTVEPLPSNYDPKTKTPTGNVSKFAVSRLDESQIGMRIRFDQRFELESVEKLPDGWRVKGGVFGLKVPDSGPPGTGFGSSPVRDPVPIRRFELHVNEECTSSTVVVEK